MLRVSRHQRVDCWRVRHTSGQNFGGSSVGLVGPSEVTRIKKSKDGVPNPLDDVLDDHVIAMRTSGPWKGSVMESKYGGGDSIDLDVGLLHSLGHEEVCRSDVGLFEDPLLLCEVGFSLRLQMNQPVRNPIVESNLVYFGGPGDEAIGPFLGRFLNSKVG